MKLSSLEPRLIKRINDTSKAYVNTLAEADGVQFKCPKCYAERGSGVGVHSVICWNPTVPQTTPPVKGRWELLGTGISDLTLKAGSSSVEIKGGCQAHFFVENGEIRMA